jgi:microcystin-dependent protein
MRNTPNIILTVWDQLMDRFSHTELASNWDRLDDHDHTTGKGKQIPNGGLGTNAVDRGNLQDAAVNAAKIEDGAVGTPELADNAVNTPKIETNAVTWTKLHAVVQNQFVPVGTIVPYAGTGDPVPGVWVIADGRLIDRTTYSTFYTAQGTTAHVYNSGADPGSNKVRIPDKRGRIPVGAVSMGTDGTNGVVAVVSTDTSRVQAGRGTVGGTRSIALGTAELPNHNHTVHNNNHSHGFNAGSHSHGMASGFPMMSHSTSGGNADDGAGANLGYLQPLPASGYAKIVHDHLANNGSGGSVADGASNVTLDAAGSGSAFNSLNPYQAHSYIVRIA